MAVIEPYTKLQIQDLVVITNQSLWRELGAWKKTAKAEVLTGKLRMIQAQSACAAN